MAAVFVAVALLWWTAFSFGIEALGRVLSRPRIRTALDRVTGTVLVALGLRVAIGD